MCVPCAKEIIDNGATNAAETADLMRELVVSQARREGRPLSPDEETFLLDLATVEADFIKAVRQCRTQMIKAQVGSPGWVRLAESLE